MGDIIFYKSHFRQENKQIDDECDLRCGELFANKLLRAFKYQDRIKRLIFFTRCRRITFSTLYILSGGLKALK